MLIMRAIDENGKWLPKSRKVYDLDENGERIRLPSGRWKSHKDELDSFNKAFRYLKKQGVDLNVNLDSLQAEYSKLQATYAELAGQLAAAKEELQPMKDIRYWVSKVLTPEQSEALKKPEPKHSVTEKMKFL